MKDLRLQFLDTYRFQYLTFYLKKNILAERGWTWNYLFYRIMRPVLKANYKFFKLFNPQSPWLSQIAILFFKQYLTKEMVGLEYGSGFSTVFYAERVKKIIAIEHHKEWYNKVKKQLEELNLMNVECVYIPENKNDWQEKLPSFYTDYPLDFNDFKYRPEYFDYFEQVKNYPDEYFDFIIVDGRSRVECSLNALPKLKKGGLFILDNSERRRYRPVFEVLKDWPMSNTSTGLTDTTFWVKP